MDVYSDINLQWTSKRLRWFDCQDEDCISLISHRHVEQRSSTTVIATLGPEGANRSSTKSTCSEIISGFKFKLHTTTCRKPSSNWFFIHVWKNFDKRQDWTVFITMHVATPLLFNSALELLCPMVRIPRGNRTGDRSSLVVESTWHPQ